MVPADLPSALIKTAASTSKKELVTLPRLGHKLLRKINRDAELLAGVNAKIIEYID